MARSGAPSIEGPEALRGRTFRSDMGALAKTQRHSDRSDGRILNFVPLLRDGCHGAEESLLLEAS